MFLPHQPETTRRKTDISLRSLQTVACFIKAGRVIVLIKTGYKRLVITKQAGNRRHNPYHMHH